MVMKHSLEVQERSYQERLRLNKVLSKNLYWRLPVDDEGHENFVPVGRGEKKSDFCGLHAGVYICRDTLAHEGVVKNGLDYTGKIAGRHRHLWCNYSSCCVCFVNGWSNRLARSIVGRLNEGVSRGFGKIEHILCSVSPKDGGLSEEAIRLRCRLELLELGVSGCMIFHGYRPDRVNKILVWSPHYHILGFISGGYRCRECNHRNYCWESGCRDFNARAWELYKKSGYFVKVFGERKTVHGSAWYQLNHATIRVGIKRFHVVTWFGKLGNKLLRSFKVKPDVPCPACGSSMERAVHVGKKHICKDIGHEDYASLFVDDEFDDAGDPNYIC